MKKSYILFLASALTLSTVACSKKDDPATTATVATTNLSATINGAQQVPANSSTATGAFVGVYTDNGTTKQLNYSVTYSNFTPTLAHIHSGAPGASGKVEIPFASLVSPITGTVTLSDDQAKALLNNGLYVNMHSSAFPSGEIRGDIKKQ